jgi:hypothetical protein
MLGRIIVTALFLFFCTAVGLVTIGLATRREYHIVLRYYVILDGDVYLHRRGTGMLLNIPFAVMLAIVAVSGGALVFWKLRRRRRQTGRGFEIKMSN